MDKIKAENANSMRESCQLYHFIKQNDIFQTFQEGEVSFNPTYKRKKNENTFVNKNAQPPSWTDRIFYRSHNRENLVLKSYSSLEEVFGSDHRPVKADFDLFLEYPFYFSDPFEVNNVMPCSVMIQNMILEFDYQKIVSLYDFLNIEVNEGAGIKILFQAEFLCETKELKIQIKD